MDVEVSDHALTRYLERVKNTPREHIARSRDAEIRDEIRRIVRERVRVRSSGDEPVVVIIDQLNRYAPGRPVVVTVLAGFKKIRWHKLRWHQRIVGVDAATLERECVV